MQLGIHMVTIEELVPEGHLLRKLEAALDLGFVYEATAAYYSRRYGRPPIDPVVLVKYLLVGYLYGIPSERQIEQRIQTDMALRWYLGLDLFDPVTDHSTISQNRRRRPGLRKIFRQLFETVVRQCIEKGLVSGRVIATDSTHVKACASRTSEYLKEADEVPGVYWDRLDDYEEQALEELEKKTGKRRGKRVTQIKKDRRRTLKQVSRTDPDAGMLTRPGKPRGMHYLSHESVDTDHGIILDVAVTSGDTGDTVPYLQQIERIHRNLVPIKTSTADSIYDFPLAHQVLGEHGISFFVRPKAEQARTTDKYTREMFAYDEEQNSYLCPAGKVLALRTVTRSASGVSWLYKAEKRDCQSCPQRAYCLSKSRSGSSWELTRSVFEPAVQRNKEQLESPEYQAALKKRQIWSEDTFAAQKWGHNLTRVLRRGLEAAKDHCLLSATALNLKRMIRCMG